MTRRHIYPEAAQILRVNEKWLRHHIKKLPHTKLGRVVYFTDADLARIDVLFHHEPGPLEGTPLGPPPPSRDLRPLPSRRRRDRGKD